jgi:predicted membrane metal-binding protein
LNALKSFLELFFMFAFAPLYSMLVIFLAVYLNAVSSVPGLVTVFVAIAPVIGVWSSIMYKRETKSAEAMAKSLEVSPEKQERMLTEYVELLRKKEEEESSRSSKETMTASS